MKVYQLFAKGNLAVVDGPTYVVSSDVFVFKAQAENQKGAFRHNVVTPRDQYDMRYLDDNDRLSIGIIELDLRLDNISGTDSLDRIVAERAHLQEVNTKLLEACEAMLADYEEGKTIPVFEIRELCRTAIAKAKGDSE